MWSLYQQAISWHVPPSELLGLDPASEYLCYIFDEAVLYFGRWVEGKLDERTKSGKPKHKLENLLKQSDDQTKPAQTLAGLLALGGGVGFVDS